MDFNNWKTRTMILATVIGAIAGAAAGYVVVRRNDELNRTPQLTPGDGLKLGLGVLGLIRLVSEFTDDEK